MQRVDRTVARWAVETLAQIEATETDELTAMCAELGTMREVLGRCSLAGFTKWSQVVAAAERKGTV